ncbi:YheC/YheD family protein [Paenibacillus contaminans]|uniref:YheC/YheD family protein n=1 Tax=Paenibacillus contaminans TaxID=450362 RepID=A0A329MQA5_9BACL|nr:YheC/YheD family protein [Paenibacillus contaminans]RAV22085.1 YheC/YheD family protein [Paenibacillus contaminans]
MKQSYVGIMVNQSLYRKLPSGRTGYEAPALYEEAAEQYGLIPCYFRLTDIPFRNRTMRAYVRKGNRYRKETVEVPKVIHNRAIFFDKRSVRKAALLGQAGSMLFNGWNRYGKLTVHNWLSNDESLKPHLPESRLATVKNIWQMLRTHDSLILKPDNSSVGIGVMKAELIKQSVWELLMPVGRFGKGRIRLVFGSALPRRLLARLRAKRYLVQQRIPLALYDGRPFDLRVSVQRDESGDWQITGIIGKVARRGAFVTNVAQGGKVMSLETLLSSYPQLDAEAVKANIETLALRVAEHLSIRLPMAADLGLDIGLREDGFPMLIECNGRDQRYSFREGGMLEEWKATYRNPIGFARFLLDSAERLAPSDEEEPGER